jgi:hypothetical protein
MVAARRNCFIYLMFGFRVHAYALLKCTLFSAVKTTADIMSDLLDESEPIKKPQAHVTSLDIFDEHKTGSSKSNKRQRKATLGTKGLKVCSTLFSLQFRR